MGIFPDAQGQVTHQSLVGLCLQDFMGFLVVSKNEEDPMKNEGARAVTTLFIDFSDAQEQLTSKSMMESC